MWCSVSWCQVHRQQDRDIAVPVVAVTTGGFLIILHTRIVVFYHKYLNNLSVSVFISIHIFHISIHILIHLDLSQDI